MPELNDRLGLRTLPRGSVCWNWAVPYSFSILCETVVFQDAPCPERSIVWEEFGPILNANREAGWPYLALALSRRHTLRNNLFLKVKGVPAYKLIEVNWNHLVTWAYEKHTGETMPKNFQHTRLREACLSQSFFLWPLSYALFLSQQNPSLREMSHALYCWVISALFVWLRPGL